MHRTTVSTSTGGLLSRLSGSKTPTRPSTSSGTPSAAESIVSRTLTFSRKASFSSSARSPKRAGRKNSATVVPNQSPEKRPHASTQHTDNTPLPEFSSAALQEQQVQQVQELQTKSAVESSTEVAARTEPARTPVSTESYTSTTPYANMLVRPATGYQSISGNGNSSFPPASPTLETITYQHIQETSSKRISTLDYLRKAHEGRVYWFNTLLFNKTDLHKMPYFDSRKLARRATNYLLLGLSLPTILDLNSSNANEFLKTLNALLSEFESFQNIHPPDGSSSSSLSRGKFPQIFRRATGAASKGRRTSSAAEIGLPMGNDSFDSKATNGSIASAGQNSATSFPIGETELLPGEEYIHLLTPSLPFDPDFYETFATLCDVLIDCYTRLMSLVSSPRECSPVVAEMFTKADAKVRKIIVQGVVKEFEESSRSGVKSEVAGVGKVVLGGLI